MTKNNSLSSSSNPALNVIRAKLSVLYKEEPNAQEEIVGSYSAGSHRSKHQEYMYRLTKSGKSLAEIQTAWHEYYVNLPDNEKHQVWNEFYKEHQVQKQAQATGQSKPQPGTHKEASENPKSIHDIKEQLLGKIDKDARLRKNHHFRSLMFGLGAGSFVVLVFLFGFFNERFITPFITPSRSVSSTPIIIDPSSSSVSDEPKIIIPKINVEIPVVYGVSTKEDSIQKGLEDGVVHMSNTPKPGELGNAAIVGHSSNNIFNRGKYKFAFVLLSKLEIGDTFYINRGGVRYVYKIFEKKVVAPSDLSVLGGTSKTASATLITCDPPGTSTNRLIIVGEQIAPNPRDNSRGSVAETEEPSLVPGNAQSLWQRITESIF